jgi:Ala-tRNA(Pro) deacylase
MEEYLRENRVSFEVMGHRSAYTMPEVAAALGISGKQVAKVVIVRADDRPLMFVVPSPDRLDFAKLRDALGARSVSLAKESEFAELFPDSATGAMPPFGNLYDVPVYVDEGLAEQTDIVFRVGTHRHVMRVAYADYARLVRPTLGGFTLKV